MNFKKLILLFSFIQINVLALTGAVNNAIKQISNEYVYQISQDHLGYMWCASGNGLIKMDADHCYNQTKINKTTSEKVIIQTVLHSNKTTWFTDKNGAIFSSTNGVIKKEYSPFNNKIIQSFEIEKDKIAFLSDSKGMFVINAKSKKGKLSLFKYKQINAVNYSNNTLWISHEKGVSKYKYIKNTLKEVNKYSIDGSISSILPISENEILIGTNNKGLLLLKTKTRKIYVFKSNLHVFSCSIKDIFKDSYNNLWVSTFGEGVIKFDYTIDKGYHKSTLIKDSQNQDNLYCNQVIEDYQKNIWIASYGKGVFFIPNNYISTFKSFENSEVVETFTKSGNNLYYAAQNKLIEEKSNKHEVILSLKPYEVIKSIALDIKSNTIFLGTEETGLYMFNKTKKRIVKLILSENKLSNQINDILIQDNKVWVATYDGLFELDKNGKVLYKYSTKNGLRHNYITCLALSKDGSLLFGSKSNKLFYIKDRIIKEQSLPISNQIVTISSIKCSKEGLIFVGSLGHGLFVVNKSKIQHFNTENGLISDYIIETNELNNTHVLIFSNQEFFILDLKTNKVNAIQRFSKTNEFFFSNNTVDVNKNEIIYGSSKGLYTFELKKYLASIKAPKPSYLRMALDERTHFENKQSPSFFINKYNHKIKFFFNCIQFSNTDKVTFFYKLEGHNKEWVETKNKFAVYNKLNYGSYRFHLKICKEKNCTVTSYPTDIIIERPFWKSIVFYTIFCVGLILILIVFLLWIYKKNKTKNRLLKDNITLKNEELERRKNDLNNSIEYTKIFVTALKSKLAIIKNTNFELFTAVKHQKSIPSDLYWYDQNESTIVVALIDTQQTDVLGGMASIWISEVLNNAFKNVKINNPKLLMQHLQESIVNKLGSDGFIHEIKATIGSINLDNLEFTICSVNQNIVIINQNSNEEIIDGQNTVLGQRYDNSPFRNQSFDLKKISCIYLLTDGYKTLNQLGLASFVSIFKSINHLKAELQKEKIDVFLKSEKNGSEQKYDDLTILGIKINR